jgi:hypothetical protein
MGNCRECKWWQQHVLPEGSELWEIIPESKPDQKDVWGICTLSNNDVPRMNARLWATGDHAYHEHWLVTAPDFGCVMFEIRG